MKLLNDIEKSELRDAFIVVASCVLKRERSALDRMNLAVEPLFLRGDAKAQLLKFRKELAGYCDESADASKALLILLDALLDSGTGNDSGNTPNLFDTEAQPAASMLDYARHIQEQAETATSKGEG